MKKNRIFGIAIIGAIFLVVACKKEVKKNVEGVAMPIVEGVVFDGEKKINLEESVVIWKGHKLFGAHTGEVELKEATLVFKDKILNSGNFIVDMNTIKATELMKDEDEGDEEEEEEGEHDDRDDLSGHLKNADFFDVEKYPEAKFTTTNVEKINDTYNINGNMTIKGTTNPINFTGKIKGNEFFGTISINRTKYGVKYGSGSFFSNLGDNVIKDNFDIIFKLRID